MAKSVNRLFRQFVPEHYTLELRPDARKMTFAGSVTIEGKKVGRPSKRLTFHQSGLKVSSVSVSNDGKAVKIDRINAHNKFDELRLHSQQTLYPGQYTVKIEFSGRITRPMNGLYPCFFEQKGKQLMLLATQFESHHAREVFPCIDEPEAKATFDLSILAPTKETVIANTPIKSQTKRGSSTLTRFATTPKMSVYLLAFVVGEVGYKQAKTKHGTIVRTYATPDNVQYTDFALDVAVKCLDFYNDYFGLEYPLEKCDLIALPDFASGAMENWGCITFREQCMFVDPVNTSLGVKQYVAMVVAHELAHQWFGNLVTMRWWTDLWLNEGFASWIEYMAVDHLFPDWQMWTQFIADEQQSALRLDALANTHPVEVPVHHPDEIRTIFDAISYNKGASVIHMLHQYLGADDFRDGLRHYLKTHQYGNTDTKDLWKSLEIVSGKPVSQFMHAWTSQPGFPLVKAVVDNGNLNVSQTRFFADPKLKDKPSPLVWPIALGAATSHELDLFTKPEQSYKTLTTVTKLNAGQGGFFRALYSQSQLQDLTKQIAQSKLDPLDRLGILADYFESAKAGYCSTDSALHLLSAYADEDNDAVWGVMAGALGSVRGVMDDDHLRDLMKPYVRKLVSKQYQRLGWKPKPKESHFDSLLRPTIIGLAALSDDGSVVKECLSRFDKMNQPSDLPADLRGVIYNTAARHGNHKTFTKLLDLHNSSSSSEERTTLASAITGFEQPELVKKALELITTDAVRLQDIPYWIAYSFMNRHAKNATWQWLTTHWDWLLEHLGNDLSFSRLPMYAARSFTDPKFEAKYRQFFEPKVTPAIERAYKQGLETISWQTAWKQRDLKEVVKFFEQITAS